MKFDSLSDAFNKIHHKDKTVRKAVCCLFVSLMLLSPSQAYSIVNCYDYVLYRLYKQDPNPPPSGYDNEILALPEFPCGKINEPYKRRVMIKNPKTASSFGDANQIRTVLDEKNYRKETWTAGTTPPPLNSYDVIIIPGHTAFVNEAGTIDHFIQIPGSSEMGGDEYFPVSLSGTFWTKAQVENELRGPLCKTVRDRNQAAECLCGGFYKGDTFETFLSRTSVRPESGEIWRNPGLTVDVLDSKDNKPVPGADVELIGKGSTPTDEKGKAVFKINPFQESNFSVSVTKDKYESKAEPLSPSHIVYLKARDPLKEMMDKLTGTLKAKNMEVKTACDNLRSIYIEFGLLGTQLRLYEGKLRGLKKSVKEASTDCVTIPSLWSEINLLVSDMKSDGATLQGKLGSANSIVCQTQEDLVKLGTLQREIIKLVQDIDLKAGAAEGKINLIRKIIDRFDDLKTRLIQEDKDLGFPLSELPKKANELLAKLLKSAEAMQSSYKEVDEKGKACLEAHDQALISFGDAIPIDTTPSGAMAPIDPRVASFQASINESRLQCSCSNDLINMIDPEAVKSDINDFKTMAPKLKLDIDNDLSDCVNLKAPTRDDLNKKAQELEKHRGKTLEWLQTIAALNAACRSKLNSPKPGTAIGQPKLITLVVSPSKVECEEGQVCPTFSATGVYSDNSQLDLTSSVKWWPPQPIRAVSPGSFPITAEYSGLTAKARVDIKPKPSAQNINTPSKGGISLTASDVQPNKLTIKKGDKPSFTFTFVYVDYNKPDLTGVFNRLTPASCGVIPDSPGTYTIGCSAIDPILNSKYEGTVIVTVVSDTDEDCPPGGPWTLRCDPNVRNNAGGAKPVDEKRIKDLTSRFNQGQWKPLETRNQNVKNQPPAQPQPPGYLSSTTTTTTTTIPPGVTTIPTTTVTSGGTTTTTVGGNDISGPTKPPQPPKPPTGGGSTSQKYAVFLVLNVFGGAGYSVVVCDVASSFLQGKQYQKKSADFNTKEGADKAYCDALESNPRSITLAGGSKAKIYGGDYWVGNATPACPKKP